MSQPQASSILGHPICIFVGTWTFVFFLYSLGLSQLLFYDITDFGYLYALITGPFLAGYLYVNVLLFGLSHRKSAGGRSFQLYELDGDMRSLIWRRTVVLLQIWMLLTVVEIVVSGGIPAIWLITGSGKSYRDFGIQSLHGFLISMLLSCSMISFYFFLETKHRRYLAMPLFALFWFIVCITRGFIVGLILQVLFLTLTAKRLTPTQVIKVSIGFICLVMFFGVIGDFRSGGADLIRAVGRPTERFPDWLPTGFLWIYIYAATPLNNLINTVQMHPSVDTYTLATTTSQLLPTFVRSVIFPQESLRHEDLVDQNLNVSTGFSGPYLDMGLLGIALFSLFIGCFASLFWARRRSRFYFLGYSFVAQTMVLSIFYDVMLYLPFMFQLFWFWYLMRRRPPAPDLGMSVLTH